MAKSIINTKKECFITKSTHNLHKHHIFMGNPQRKYAEQDGLWVWLSDDYHNMSNKGVHYDRDFNLYLKRIAQQKYEETHTREEWRKRYIKSFL